MRDIVLYATDTMADWEVGLYPDSLIDAWLALQASNEADDFFRLIDEYGAFANA